MNILRKLISFSFLLLPIFTPVLLASDDNDLVTICKIDTKDPRHESTVKIPRELLRLYLEQGSFLEVATNKITQERQKFALFHLLLLNIVKQKLFRINV